MKTIYLVRHGESEGNTSNLIYNEDVILTDKGRIQAAKLADRCAYLNIDLIIHSGLKRARETADIILKKIEVPHEVNDDLYENNPPSSLVGKIRGGEEQMEFAKIKYENIDDKHFKYDDEESIDELSKRADRVLKYLESVEHDNILIVSHAYFIRVIIARLILSEDYSSKTFLHIIDKIKVASNTSITTIIYNSEEGHKWKLKNYNDESHLS